MSISSRDYGPRSCLVGLTLQILGLMVVSASWAQTAAQTPEGQSKRSKVDCHQNIGQEKSCTNADDPRKPNSQDTPSIQDNSFLIEEAYNQEFGVVQHIQSFQRYWNSKDWIYTFTQEWPVDASPRNQLSYTLMAVHAGDQPATSGGFGDMLLNYRYQLLGNGESKVAFAPRLSVLLPTGDYRLGRGVGGAGVQFSLPFSVVVSRKLVTHWNAGATIIPNARNEAGETAATHGYNLGQSFVWLARPRFNVLLETVFNRSQQVTAPKTTQWTSDVLLNPGVRWAYNFKNGLQIVPGIGVPIGVGPSDGEKGVFIYLSFEHPYRKLPKE